MVRRHLIQEIKDHMNDYVRVFQSEYHFNYILNDLHPPQSSSGIELVDKWLTFSNMGHIVATYYNRLVVELTDPKIGTSKSSLKPYPMSGLIPNHFVFVFLKDDCPPPPSSTEWKLHKSEEASSWEFKYLDQPTRFRDLMNIEKGDKTLLPKKESNQDNPIL